MLKFLGRLSMAVLPAALLACGDDNGTGASGEPEVAIAFQVSQGAAKAAQSGLTLSGSNGELRITDMHLIVNQFELKRADVDCDGAADEDACEKFEAPPAFVAVPLDGSEVLVVDRAVPSGRYEKLEFEVEDLEVDEGDSLRQAQAQALTNQIRASFPDWPRKASLLAEGSFTPTGGTARSFRTYFKAEIEIELDFATPLVLSEGDPDRTVSVTLAPRQWFTLADGTVMDLSDVDYTRTGDLAEFEVEIEDGFSEVEWD